MADPLAIRRPFRRPLRAGSATAVVAGLAALVSLLAGVPGAVALTAPAAAAAPVELLVGFAEATPAGVRDEMHRLAGAELVERYDGIPVDALRVAPEAAVRYDGGPVRAVGRAQQRAPSRCSPRTPCSVSSGACRRSSHAGRRLGCHDRQPLDRRRGRRHRRRHRAPDLAANIWRNDGEGSPPNGADDDGNGYVDDLTGWDFAHDDRTVHDAVVNTCDGRTEREDDHGTHVAGIVGAVGGNGVGVAGVAWDVRVMPLKVLGACGAGQDSDAIEAIAYAIRMGADVIDLSWGGAGYSEWLRQALLAARDAGILVTVAAGNNGADLRVAPEYPAAYGLPNQVTVAARVCVETGAPCTARAAHAGETFAMGPPRRPAPGWWRATAASSPSGRRHSTGRRAAPRSPGRSSR